MKLKSFANKSEMCPSLSTLQFNENDIHELTWITKASVVPVVLMK
jgi:hypothetical protein